MASVPLSLNEIFNVNAAQFVALANRLLAWQVQHNPVYAAYTKAIGKPQHSLPDELLHWPIPISFFKSHKVVSFSEEPVCIFSSSTTTGQVPSLQFLPDTAWYTNTCRQAFTHAFGDPNEYAWLCLLPSYLERSGSSLVYMADQFVRQSKQSNSGFFLKADDALAQTIQHCISHRIPTVLLGVSFALLDFAEKHTGLPMRDVIVMETGGMKGRRKELIREELHQILKEAFGVSAISSEYGMTELMSQAYARSDGLYHPPPWMRVYVRSEDDPFHLQKQGTGLLCILDLANVFSAAFIETQDVGRVWQDGSFEVLGRLDASDIRGCSLLVA